jgi:hypothetical protein
MSTIDETFEMFDSMEAEHTDRGLRFFRSGLGHTPVQAYGEIDGEYFYFRFRHDMASIEVGPYDEPLELACAAMQKRQRGSSSLFEAFDLAEAAEDAPGRKFLPQRVTASAQIIDATGNGAADLDLPAFRTLFNRVLAELQLVPEHRQIDQLTIDWLTKGGFWPVERTA